MTTTAPLSLIVQPEAGLTPVIHAMRHAKRTIDVAIFRLTRKDVQDALGAAVARGIKVRALVAHKNGSNENRLRRLEQQLLGAGVTVARTADEFVKYHGKFIIIDDTLHLLGFNLTKTDITKTRSFGIRTRDRRAVQDAMALFESDLTRQPFSVTRASPLVVSPETARTALEKLLSRARKRLAIYDGRLDDPVCVKLIRQRAAAGVEVKILGKAPGLAKDVPVRELKNLRLHVRAIICDGNHAFVGSQSMRRLELDGRREVGLIITNPAVARRMLRIFEEDWEASAKKKDQDETLLAQAAPNTAQPGGGT